MHIPLSIHLSIHFLLAVLAGFLVGRFFKKEKLGIIGGIIGGFLIDLDHILEYFFTFGLRFNLQYFLEGREFLVSNKIILVFHGWEYLLILLPLAWLLRRRENIKVFLLALALGGTVHLASDCILNAYPVRNYSIIYRASQGFSNDYLLSPVQRELNDKLRQKLGI